jgi:uncharacterized protein YndB with AHSA1/START domain
VTRGNRGSVRREVRIECPPADVWAYVGAPERLHEWFPGIESCTVEGNTRVIVTGSGIPMPEELVTIDPLQRRFQYRITAPIVKEHLSTIDVIDVGDGTTLVVYSVDADPATMALVIGGAAGNALAHLGRMLTGAGTDAGRVTT